jgi:opacity protein-like surface antigen
VKWGSPFRIARILSIGFVILTTSVAIAQAQSSSHRSGHVICAISPVFTCSAEPEIGPPDGALIISPLILIFPPSPTDDSPPPNPPGIYFPPGPTPTDQFGLPAIAQAPPLMKGSVTQNVLIGSLDESGPPSQIGTGSILLTGSSDTYDTYLHRNLIPGAPQLPANAPSVGLLNPGTNYSGNYTGPTYTVIVKMNVNSLQNTFAGSVIIPQNWSLSLGKQSGPLGLAPGTNVVRSTTVTLPINATHNQDSNTVTINQVYVLGQWQPCQCTVNLTVASPAPPNLGGPVHVSMHGSDMAFGGLDGFSSRGSGTRVSDTAGLIAPGTLGPAFHSIDTGGGLNLTVDASRFFGLGNNQHLWLALTGDIHSDFTSIASLGTTPINANAGSARSNIYTLVGSAKYQIDNVYFGATAAFNSNHTDITNNAMTPGAQGQTDGRGYALQATIGELFPIVNTTGLNPMAAVKTPPKAPGGYALFVDAGGHFGYSYAGENAFSDSSGFAYGALRSSYGDVGAHARLMAVIPDSGFAWMPFVGLTVDQLVGLRDTFDLPAQLATPADTLIFSPATTFWGAELGVDILTRGSVKFGMKGFYQASADTQTFGGAAFLKIPFEDLAATTDSGIRIAPRAGMPLKAPPPSPPAFWSWAGLYIGAHVGGALSTTKFSDPFGAPIYGDTVRSPGFLGGGQIGYNWQAPGSRWVFGVESDGSLMSSDGDATCFAASSVIVTTTCRVRPRATGTFTGRVGYAFGPDGHTLVYGKGGLAWANDEIDMALNGLSVGPVRANASEFSNNQSVTLWGGTVGVGVERALTPAWSLKAEYDYVDLGRGNVANLGGETIMPLPPYAVGVLPPSTSGVSQNIQELKLGLNYKWGADPWAAAWQGPATSPMFSPAAGWEVEGGARYFGSWGQFHKDFGIPKTLGPDLSDVSRLNYDDMQTNSGEFFGRIDTPWNLFVKGYIGSGATNMGHANDEDVVLINGISVGAYSNTLSPTVTGNIEYGAIDGGFDFLRGLGYKVGVFGGYFHFNEGMNAFGCAAIAFINCTPNPVPTYGSPVITENDKWEAVRIGVAAETMLTDRVEISGEAAYLPRVWFNGLDQHFVGNTGVLAEVFPASGNGSGVQVETLLSYYLTSQWSVGAGGRYWGMWTTPNGQWNCTFGCGGTFAAPQFYKAQVEQLGAFVQTSYKFDWGGSVVARQ